MSRDEDRLEDMVRFGAEAEAFLKSDIGRYLLDRSQEQVDAALHELSCVDPCNSRDIRRLQNVIQRNRDVEAWLGEIVQAGWEARNLLAGEDI